MKLIFSLFLVASLISILSPSFGYADKTDVLKDVLKPEFIPGLKSYPFSFSYNDQSSKECLDTWPSSKRSEPLDANRMKTTVTWTAPDGLKVTAEFTSFSDYPGALEWILYFENSGKSDTKIIKEIQSLDLVLQEPKEPAAPYILHRTEGDTASYNQFNPSQVSIKKGQVETLGTPNGCSSRKDLPFFKIETGKGSLISAVGWSGQWKATLETPDNQNLHMMAGFDDAHFKLYPGEKVRSPRMLLFYLKGDTWESNAQFRQLIYKHYVPLRNGKKPLPLIYFNTWYATYSAEPDVKVADILDWDEKSQLSILNAYRTIGIESFIMDAGWFAGQKEHDWISGSGNWAPDPKRYPRGVAPIAKAALDQGIAYGMWFMPEIACAGSEICTQHPEWVLGITADWENGYPEQLINFGLPAVQKYFLDMLETKYMNLPGFSHYRQDFEGNGNPLAVWRAKDAPDRIGMTEIQHIQGVYAYWDEIARKWPDAIMEGCAAGGTRIDLETISRFHFVQKTDCYLTPEIDQSAIWGLSQYLPNGSFDVPLARMDDYAFHSSLGSSLPVGWVADAPKFDLKRAQDLVNRYKSIRHLLIGAWYPLLPFSPCIWPSEEFVWGAVLDPVKTTPWMAVQYHRPELEEGLILAFRRNNKDTSIKVSPRAIKPKATYELCYHTTNQKKQIEGSVLMKDFEVVLPSPNSSELIHYKMVK